MSTQRDRVLARLAAARSCALSALDQMDEALALFVDPDEDKKGEERLALMDSADEDLGRASRSIQEAIEQTESLEDWLEPEFLDDDNKDDEDSEEE